MCSVLSGGGKASCSGQGPPLLPGAYCKRVQDETPTRKHFLPVPVSGSASCECCGELERGDSAWVWSAGHWGGAEGMLQGVGLWGLVLSGSGGAGSHGLRFWFWGLWCAMPQSHVLPRYGCVIRWGTLSGGVKIAHCVGFYQKTGPGAGRL